MQNYSKVDYCSYESEIDISEYTISGLHVCLRIPLDSIFGDNYEF